jgi:hypothetical protein
LNSKCIHIVLLKLTFINLKLCSSSTSLKFENNDCLLCRIVCGKNSPSHSRCKNKVSCDVNSAYLQSFHHRRPKSYFLWNLIVYPNLRKNIIFNCFNLKEMNAIKDNVVLLRITESVLPQLQCKC